MSQVKFFTPITFDQNVTRSWKQAFLQNVDGYFYLGGKKARVFNNGECHLLFHQSSFALSCLKVASYFTLILPTLMLVAKVVLRWNNVYELNDEIPISLLATTTLGLNLEAVTTLDHNNFEEIFHGYIPETYEMNLVVTDVITEINKAVLIKSAANPTASSRVKNTVLIDVNMAPWNIEAKRANLNLYNMISDSGTILAGPIESTWLFRIVKALEDRQYINIESDTGHGYTVRVLN